MTEHTPTPWEVTDRSTYFGIRSYAKCGGGGDNRLVAACAKPHVDAAANAAFIVQVVNEREALLAEHELMRRTLEIIAGNSADQLQATQARGALANIGPRVDVSGSGSGK